ncbi:unnamed protein product [Didymodactylos carnosus]|uniref:Tetraspanin n=1 Tax=Didymodactylos carnosus TaxID=1234261 RepID=A0A8S2D080_9BILA|nr:unnamed protein product [Didymodactylos carnosus]CAF3629138.1 unnamed protein product [Didymodactylos carnosus]
MARGHGRGDPNIQQGMSYIEMIAISVIVLGSILLVLGFLGCCGAMKQVRCMLTLYSFIIGAIILAEVALTIYFVAFQSNFKDQFVPKLQQSISQNYAGPPIMGNKPGVVSLAWDFIMFNLQCCGAQNGTDFVNTPKWNKTNPWAPYQNLSYPLTCCPIQNAPKDWNTLSEDTLKQAETCAVDGLNIYKDGCYNKLIELIGSYKLYVIIGAVIVLVIELLAFIFAIALCCRTSKEQLYYNS